MSLLSQIIEEMNLEKLYQTYSRIRENKITPRQILKIVIYANMNRIYSSRDMEKAREKLLFKNLLKDYVPTLID